MYNDTIAQLKVLKNIAPNEEFARRSRALLIAHPPERRSMFFMPRYFKLAGVLTFAALLLVLSPLFPSSQPALSSSLDATRLAGEFNNLAVNIQLREIRYQQGANQTVASAVNEIADTRTNHLNPSTITKEMPTLAEDETQKNIDTLLGELTQ